MKPLRSPGRRGADDVPEAIAQQGFALLRGYAPELDILKAITTVGKIVRLEGFKEAQILKPQEKGDSTPNTYSGNYGLDAFPMHTDLAHWHLPPRYLALRCVQGTAGVATRLLDGANVINALGKQVLQRALVQPRRPVAGMRQIMRLLEQPATDASCLRWDQLFLTPATSASVDTFSAMHDCVSRSEAIEICLVDPGDTLIVDNWRMLHGRNAAAAATGRHIERVYMGELH